jgi:colanic acid/amylovoran biosynthesis protein
MCRGLARVEFHCEFPGCVKTIPRSYPVRYPQRSATSRGILALATDSSPPVRIVQVGTYSSENKGDAAMELSTAQELSERLANAEITIQSPFPDIDTPAYQEYRVTKTTRRRLIYNSVLVSRAAAWSLARRYGKNLDFLVDHPEIQDMLAADVVIDLSGDMLTEDYGVHVAYSHYLPLLLALALHRPLVICAQSVGPFKWTRPLIRRILDRAKLITVRDQISLDHLQELGIQNPRLFHTADMAFLLRPAPEARVEEIYRLEGIPSDKTLLGVSVSGLIRSRYKQWNSAAHAAPFESVMANIVDRAAKAIGASVVFVPHVTGPASAKDDRIVSRAVADKMESQVTVLGGNYTPNELKGVIRRTNLFFGARMHANIAALSSAVPTVPISYSHKTQGITRALGQEQRVIPIAQLNVEDAAKRLLDVWEQREHISAELRDKVAAIRTQSQRNVDLILELLGKVPEP